MTTSSAPDRGTVDVVLPCLDEAEALPWVLARIPPGWRALVVDNGSTDGSADIARALGAHRRPRAAARLRRRLPRGTDRGHGRHRLLLRLRRLARPGRCSCRSSPTGPRRRRPTWCSAAAGPQARGAWPLHARAGNLALARMLRRRTGLRLHDLGPLRAARREALLALGLTDRRSGYPLQMVVRAADAGWRVAEDDVPVPAAHRRAPR